MLKIRKKFERFLKDKVAIFELVPARSRLYRRPRRKKKVFDAVSRRDLAVGAKRRNIFFEKFSKFFFDFFWVAKKVTFWSHRKSTRYIRRAKNFSGASKNKNFPSSFDVFSTIRAGKRSRVDFGTKNR